MGNEGSSNWTSIKQRIHVTQHFNKSKCKNEEQSTREQCDRSLLWEKKKKQPHPATPTASAYDAVTMQAPQQGFSQGPPPASTPSWTNPNSSSPPQQSPYSPTGFAGSPNQQWNSQPNLTQSPLQYSGPAYNQGLSGHAADYYRPSNHINNNDPGTGAAQHGHYSWPQGQGNGNSGYPNAPDLEAGQYGGNHPPLQTHSSMSSVNNNHQDSLGYHSPHSTQGPYQDWHHHAYSGGPSTGPGSPHHGPQFHGYVDNGNDNDDGSAAFLARRMSRRQR